MNLNRKKILLACPVSEFKAYILLDWIQYIKQNFGHVCDILLIDNSTNKRFHREIAHTNTPVIWRPPRKGELLTEVMADCLNIINRKLQRYGYTHWFSVECDVFPPAGTLDVLMAYRQPVIAASYCINFGVQRKMMYQVAEGFKHGKVFNMSQLSSFTMVDGQFHPVLSPGLGCTLIRADVVHDYTFRVDTVNADKVHADTFFFVDLKYKNIPVYVHTGIICNHLNSNWNDINKKFKQRAV